MINTSCCYSMLGAYQFSAFQKTDASHMEITVVAATFSTGAYPMLR